MARAETRLEFARLDRDASTSRGTARTRTGAGREIGAEIGRAMARAGVAVVLAAHDDEDLARVAAEIESQDGRAVVTPTDVSAPQSVERLVACEDAKIRFAPRETRDLQAARGRRNSACGCAREY
jgi:hypothetical protein